MLEFLKFLPTLIHHSLLTPAGPFFKEEDYPDLTNQKWVVTGATGGIGLELAKILVRKNTEVWIVGRSVTKLESAEAELHQLNPSAVVHRVVIDYNDLATVKPALEKLRTETTSLNGIIHNAGVMNVPKGSKTKQGHEQTFGVNNLATQLVQDLLDPLIVHTPNARIVWLSSLGHIGAPNGGFNPKLLVSGSPVFLYFMSKAVDYIQSVQWSRKHPEATNVKSLSAHPGIIRSDLTRTSSQHLVALTNWLYYDTPYGALAPIFAALSPDAVNNDYIVPFGRPGPVRPDIYQAARDERGEAVDAYVEDKIKEFK